MTTSSTTRCAYCDRGGQPLEPCCGRDGHAGRLVCQDSRDCMGEVLVQLHDPERREDEWAAYCARSDRAAELRARITVAGAVASDFRRERAEFNAGRSAGPDWELLALRLDAELRGLLGALSRTGRIL